LNLKLQAGAFIEVNFSTQVSPFEQIVGFRLMVSFFSARNTAPTRDSFSGEGADLCPGLQILCLLAPCVDMETRAN